MVKRNLIPLVLVLLLAIAVLAAPAMAGLTVDPADPDSLRITEMDGSVTYTFTITEALLAQDETITIDVWLLQSFVGDGASFITNDNVIVEDTAGDAVWTRDVVNIPDDPATPLVDESSSILTLTSTVNDTIVGETVSVTFTGANGNPWKYDALIDDPDSIPLGAIRSDESAADPTIFNLRFNIPPGTLSVVSGEKITATDGATWANFTVTDAPIIKDGTIIIPVIELNQYVASGTFTTANVVVEDSVADPTVWKGIVAGNLLTLTSTGGRTPVGSWVNVTLTGAANPWIPDTDGPKLPVDLTGTRSDSAGIGTFTFEIETAPPAGFHVVPDFTASPRSDIAQLTVGFTDLSTGNPTMWNWSFGDGEWFNTTDRTKMPITHKYENVGTYTVSLTAGNDYSSHTKSTTKDVNDIHVLNGTIVTANTSITGLTTEIVGGQQFVTVDTSKLPDASLIPNNSVLEIKPPADRGWKNITIYAMPGVFVRAGSTITGTVTGVHLVSAEIAPSSPTFSLAIGPTSSFNYSIDLATYPSSATLTTKIWEGVIEEYDTKFRQVFNSVSCSGTAGTAYTAKVTKTNFPSGTSVKLHMSVKPSWITSLQDPDGIPFIARLSDDFSEGQILDTQFLSFDPITNLKYYEADSPRGLSTFGLYSITDPNNPFQLVALAIANVVSNPPSNSADPKSGPEKTTVPVSVQNPIEAKAQAAPAPADPGQTATVYANANGVVTQATSLHSTDGLATINLGLGVVALNAAGTTLSSISVAAVPAENLPALASGTTVSYAGMMYNMQPDGATFSPAISISFTVPQGQWAQDYTIRSYDRATGTWQDLPTTYDARTGTVTAEVSNFCLFALFAKNLSATAPAAAQAPPAQVTVKATPAPPSPTIMTTFTGMILWVVNLMIRNPVVLAGIVILAVGIILFVWKQRRDRLIYRP